MKTLFLIIHTSFLISLLNSNSNAQTPQCQWANTSLLVNSNTSSCYANSVATDSYGNVYVVGNFSDSIVTFGSITLKTKKNSVAMFIVKYDANGNALWAKSDAGYGSSATAVTIDKFNNIYVVGYFSSSFTFNSQTYVSNGYCEIFTIKYDMDGNVIWINSAGGANT
ncbi:MAG: hypothetical protein A3K10_09220 [Bacteroidetes bacterium RIFCSPLOWO2_12_FULL_31_6]|nr:MAG: hypothetical protein A3K10_09220 [Bacteroidetes bacterium RIFCSPLOWO2_12_FULL_31_6]